MHCKPSTRPIPHTCSQLIKGEGSGNKTMGCISGLWQCLDIATCQLQPLLCLRTGSIVLCFWVKPQAPSYLLCCLKLSTTYFLVAITCTQLKLKIIQLSVRSYCRNVCIKSTQKCPTLDQIRIIKDWLFYMSGLMPNNNYVD